ncbi:hypothetical protein MF271_22100 (plasmid) [Deinococcus sp. KNUC1210]|uniref:hypothetical protein n=1 Tax=Deinococcus sp. KNUC1210 TaxID=2917691 RepID=UPI001EF05DD1|nr:hypothetical protein [Deinococcus sp. KNUC1210]ULH18171.1 hypothetical protein MF271_22100 [Deinococcus sp. KNUC1210]
MCSRFLERRIGLAIELNQVNRGGLNQTDVVMKEWEFLRREIPAGIVAIQVPRHGNCSASSAASASFCVFASCSYTASGNGSSISDGELKLFDKHGDVVQHVQQGPHSVAE